ncbi:MAG: phage holin family protein [Thermoleophilia bacterium]
MDQRSTSPVSDAGRELKDKSLPGLLSDLSRSIPELIRAEIALVKAQIMGKASLVGQGAGFFVAAIAFLMMAIATGTALAVIVFDLFLPLWLAALLITVLWLLIAAGLGYMGFRRFQRLSGDDAAPPAPPAKAPTVSASVDKTAIKVEKPAVAEPKPARVVSADADETAVNDKEGKA